MFIVKNIKINELEVILAGVAHTESNWWHNWAKIREILGKENIDAIFVEGYANSPGLALHSFLGMPAGMLEGYYRGKIFKIDPSLEYPRINLYSALSLLSDAMVVGLIFLSGYLPALLIFGDFLKAFLFGCLALVGGSLLVALPFKGLEKVVGTSIIKLSDFILKYLMKAIKISEEKFYAKTHARDILMALGILRVLERYSFRKVLVVTGAAHVKEIANCLANPSKTVRLAGYVVNLSKQGGVVEYEIGDEGLRMRRIIPYF